MPGQFPKYTYSVCVLSSEVVVPTKGAKASSRTHKRFFSALRFLACWLCHTWVFACHQSLERASIRTGVLPDRSPSFVLLTIYIWRRASGVPPRLGLKRAYMHAVVHISKDYEGFPGKCAEDHGAVFLSRNGLGRRRHRYH